MGGFRLNTDPGKPCLELGRAFGFSYGDKENGSFFSHMNVMLANGLYKRDFIREGREVIDSLYRMATSDRAGIPPVLPEYFNSQAKGLYLYLTGSASWYMLTLVTEAFGVRGVMGNLLLEPKLMAEQFDPVGKASLGVNFGDRELDIVFMNQDRLDYGDYCVRSVLIDGRLIEFSGLPVIIPRNLITSLNRGESHHIEIELSR